MPDNPLENPNHVWNYSVERKKNAVGSCSCGKWKETEPLSTLDAKGGVAWLHQEWQHHVNTSTNG